MRMKKKNVSTYYVLWHSAHPHVVVMLHLEKLKQQRQQKPLLRQKLPLKKKPPLFRKPKQYQRIYQWDKPPK